MIFTAQCNTNKEPYYNLSLRLYYFSNNWNCKKIKNVKENISCVFPTNFTYAPCYSSNFLQKIFATAVIVLL